MGPGAEKIRVAGDFILENSKLKTVGVEQVKSKGTYSQQKKKKKKPAAGEEEGLI